MLREFDFSAVRVLVIGDVMLDRYWLGSVDRVSPEAPVPVVKIGETDLRVGGAGNVAANVCGLGAKCHLVSVIGDDGPGNSINDILEQHGVNRHLHIDPQSRTTEKLRIIAKNQQLLRVDFEDTPRREVVDRCLSDYEELVGDVDVIIMSDYGKGSIQSIGSMIKLAKTMMIPVVVDPKGVDFSRYKGATIITPNEFEFLSAVGPWSSDQDMERKANALIHDIEIDGLLITRGEVGMTMFSKNNPSIHQEAKSVEVYDVSGAGDTVVSSVALGIAAGFDWTQILNFSNSAAGVVVKKLGTSITTLNEVQAAMNEGLC